VLGGGAGRPVVDQRSAAARTFDRATPGYRDLKTMLIALLKRLAVPVPIIGVAAVWLIRFKRQRQLKKAGKASAP